VSTHRPIEAVIFDYAGVLGLAPFENASAFEASMGYPEGAMVRLLFGDYVSPDAIAPGEVHDWHLLEIGQIDLATFVARVVEKSPQHLAGATFDPVAFFNFLRTAPFGVHWMVVDYYAGLKARGVRLAILTNNVREWGEGWKSTIPMDIFDVVIDSSEVGVRKPDRKIYELACQHLGVEPHVAVFLDDNLANVNGARAVGMEAVLVGKDVWAALAELDAILDARRAASH